MSFLMFFLHCPLDEAVKRAKMKHVMMLMPLSIRKGRGDSEEMDL